MNNTADNIQVFIIETSLITPIKKIIQGLQNGEYRDCDINWLQSKMDAFTQFAAKTLNLSVEIPLRDPKAQFTVLNSYVLQYFTDRFITLLNYFNQYTN